MGRRPELAAPQPGIFPLQPLDLVGEGIALGLGPPLLIQGHQGSAVALPLPGRQMGGVETLASQNPPDTAGLIACFDLLQDA